jgi:hypothetical protein
MERTASAAPQAMIAWSATSHRLEFSLNSETRSPLLHGSVEGDPSDAFALCQLKPWFPGSVQAAAISNGLSEHMHSNSGGLAKLPEALGGSPEPQGLQPSRKLHRGRHQLRIRVLRGRLLVGVVQSQGITILPCQALPSAGGASCSCSATKAAWQVPAANVPASRRVGARAGQHKLPQC